MTWPQEVQARNGSPAWVSQISALVESDAHGQSAIDGTPTATKVLELAPCFSIGCANTAGNKCDRGGCLIHCRAQGGVLESQSLPEAERLTMEEAIKLSQGGRLVGKGCEAHEAKDQARRDRKASKRKAKSQIKSEVQAAKQSIDKKRKEREASPAIVSTEGQPISSPQARTWRPEEKKVKIDAVVM